MIGLFRGLSAFPITPASAEGRADIAVLHRLLDRLITANVDSVGLLGSTGSYAYLTLDERKRVAEAAVQQTRGHVPLIIGVGALRTDHTQALARHATSIGADGLLLAPVSYTPLTEDEVFQHFTAVAEISHLPICIYNNPSTTHFTFSVSLLRRLATIPAVRAVKMPLPADEDVRAAITQLRAELPDDFVIGYSGDWGCGQALLDGADSWFSVVAGLLPEPALRLTRAAMAGDTAETARWQAAFAPLWALFRQHGSLRVVHAAAGLTGLGDSLPPRPILPMPQSDLPQLSAILAALEST